MLRVAPHSKQHLNLLIAFKDRIRQKADVLRFLTLGTQPVRVQISIVGQCFEVLSFIYVDKVIGAVDLAERLVEFFVVAPAVGFGTEKGEPRPGIAKERRHILGHMLGGNPVYEAVTFFAPGGCRWYEN